MKNQILILLGSLGMSFAGFAQSSVNWSAISFANFTAQTNAASVYGGGSLPGGAVGDIQGSASLGTGYYFELLIGSVWNGTAEAPPTTFAGLSSWTDSGLEASNSLTHGRIVPMNPNPAATVNALSATVSNNIMLVGWSANLGSTWSAALVNNMEYGDWTGNAFLGESVVGYIEGATLPAFQGNNLFGTTAQTYGTPIQSLNTPLYMLAIPEPGTMALAALGGASLLLSRRKKKSSID